MREAAALRSLVMLGVLLGVSLVSADVQAEPIGSGGSRAPLELTTRGMLLQRWDRNRDGKIDLGEAEMARVQMRRERMEREEKSRVDPLTGRRSQITRRGFRTAAESSDHRSRSAEVPNE